MRRDPALADPCPIAPVVELVFGRWTSHVLWTLAHHGRLRFGELRDLIPGVTPKVLTQRLRQLERDGFISRTYYPAMPPRVEYECTSLALSLQPIFARIVEWSDTHLDDVHEARHQFDHDEAASRPVQGSR
jgi:DNA-binding HxlR family transcriptional regulator